MYLLAWVSGLVAAAVALAAFIFQVRFGLNLIEFGDETEKFVAAQMLWKGHHLYGDVYAAHGPVPYIIAHLYTALVSREDFSYIRIFQGALAVASGVALALSPVFKTTPSRVWGAALYLLALSSVWTSLWMHMLLYQSISGFLFAVVLSQLVLPLFFEQLPTWPGLAASGIAAALIFFSAYSLGPAIALLFLASLLVAWRLLRPQEILRCIRLVFFGLLAGASVVVLWLWRFGDLEGYIVYHIYSMQRFYAPFINYSPSLVFKNIGFSFAPATIVHSLALMALAASLYIFLVLPPEIKSRIRPFNKACATTLIAAGALMTNPRADFWFPDSAFVIVSFALLAMAGGLVLDRALLEGTAQRLGQFCVLTAAVVCLSANVKTYASPNGIKDDDLQKFRVEMRPQTGGIYGFIRSIAKRESDVLSLIYEPDVYIKAGRLPASGNYYYLPWQAAYNKQAVRGYRIDICNDIARQRPAVIWLFNWRVWNKYAIEDYEPCVLPLIREGYIPLSFDSPWYIRKDLFSAIGAPPQDTEEPEWLKQTMRLSYPLASFSPLGLAMTPGHKRTPTPLKRIGVLIGTSTRRNAGEVELRLRGADGSVSPTRVSLSDVDDNAYHYFDVDRDLYTSGEIASITGEGISTWESHLENGDTYTCLIYEYANGQRRFTPGCPLM